MQILSIVSKNNQIEHNFDLSTNQSFTNIIIHQDDEYFVTAPPTVGPVPMIKNADPVICTKPDTWYLSKMFYLPDLSADLFTIGVTIAPSAAPKAMCDTNDPVKISGNIF